MDGATGFRAFPSLIAGDPRGSVSGSLAPSIMLRTSRQDYRNWDAGSVLLRNRRVHVCRGHPDRKDRYYNPLDGGRPVDRMHPPSPLGSPVQMGTKTPPSPSRSDAEAPSQRLVRQSSRVAGRKLVGQATNGASPTLMQRKMANPLSPWDRVRGASLSAALDKRETEEDDKESVDLDEVRERMHARVEKYRKRYKHKRLLDALLTSVYIDAVEAIWLPEVNAAAIKVQAAQRGRQGRRATAAARQQKEQQKADEENAATKVQSLYRGKQCRKEVEQLRRASLQQADAVDEGDPDYEKDDDFEAEDFEDDFEADDGVDASAQVDDSDGPLTPVGGDAASAASVEAAHNLLREKYGSTAGEAEEADVARASRAAAISENLQAVYERVLARLRAAAQGDAASDDAAASFVLLVCRASLRAAAQGDG